jgi:hypothetical protein
MEAMLLSATTTARIGFFACYPLPSKAKLPFPILNECKRLLTTVSSGLPVIRQESLANIQWKAHQAGILRGGAHRLSRT